MLRKILSYNRKTKVQHEYFKHRRFKVPKIKLLLVSGFILFICVIILELTNDHFILKAFARSIENNQIFTENNIIDEKLLTNNEKIEIKCYLNMTKNAEITLYTYKYAKFYGIQPSLLFAIMKIESRYNVRSRNYNYNKSIDRGLFQLNSYSFPYLTESDFFDADVNIMNGAKYLRWCLDLTDNNVVKALAAYNAGIRTLNENRIGMATLEYIQNVLNEKHLIDTEVEKEQ
jgi:hypothetical protein